MFETPNEYYLDEARRERAHRIARHQLIEQALAARKITPTQRRYAPLLAWLGRRLTAAGLRLQRTYAARVPSDWQALTITAHEEEIAMRSL